MDLHELRQEYTHGGLSRENLADHPLDWAPGYRPSPASSVRASCWR